MSDRTPIDKIVEASLDKVVRTTVKEKRGYWTPAEVLQVALSNSALKVIIKDLSERYGATVPEGPWHIDQIVLRYIKDAIGSACRVRDSVTKMRLYESYAVPGHNERRFMFLTSMTAMNLQAAMEQARTQERQLHRKGEGYHILLEELQKAGAGATVADIMPQALPRILAYRAKSA